jgi:hypothetical protein
MSSAMCTVLAVSFHGSRGQHVRSGNIFCLFFLGENSVMRIMCIINTIFEKN